MSSPLIRGAITGLAVGAVTGLLVIGVELGGMGSWTMLVMGMAAIAILVGAVSLLAIPFRRVRARAAKVAACSLAFVLSTFVYPRAAGEARSYAFARLSDRSEALVRAIEEYESSHGRPPATLGDLVPSFLSEMPGTGMPAYPAYEYEVFPYDAASVLHWYDLGSRDGEGFRGLWKYVDGDPDHAIFVVTTDRAGTVLALDTDRLPQAEFEDSAFDRARWDSPTERLPMLRDFARKLEPVGKPFETVSAALGPADGSRTLLNAKWELRVPCSIGLLNWDVFFYWPTQHYPDHAYGGSIERIGKWAYVHE